jgi:hypothetical protein
MSILSENISPRSLFYKVLIAFITITLIALMFPKGESIESEVTEGTIWLNDDLIAAFSFPIIKSEEVYQAELKAAEKKVFPVFINNPEVKKISIDSLKTYSNYLIELLDYVTNNDSVKIVNSTFLSTASFKIFQSIRLKERNLVLTNGYKLKNLFVSAGYVLNKVYKKGILNINEGEETKDSIAIRVGNVDEIKPISKFLFFDKAREEIAREVNRFNYPDDIEKALIEYTIHFLFPNLI